MTNTPPIGDASSGPRLRGFAGIDHDIHSYITHCLAAGQDPRHVAQKKSHLRRFTRETRALTLADITLETLTRNADSLRERGRSARTANWRRQIVVCWLNWCVKTGRLDRHNCADATRYDESDDQRRVRRAITDDECARLLAVADAQGPLRSLWYRLACECGLRRGELVRLRWADVDLDARVLTLRGTKAKRADAVPLLADTAERLSAVKPDAFTLAQRVFAQPVTDAERREDFFTANIPATDARGRVADLHSLRSTLATRLARSGVSPAITKTIMRHRSIETTLRHYTDLQIDDMRRAMRDSVPAPGTAPGTDPCASGASFGRWLARCPVPLSEPHRRAIAGFLLPHDLPLSSSPNAASRSP